MSEKCFGDIGNLYYHDKAIKSFDTNTDKFIKSFDTNTDKVIKSLSIIILVSVILYKIM